MLTRPTLTFGTWFLMAVIIGIALRVLLVTGSDREPSRFTHYKPAPVSARDTDVLRELLAEVGVDRSAQEAWVALEAEFLAVLDQVSARYDRIARESEAAWRAARSRSPRIRRIRLPDPDALLSSEVVGDATTHRAWAIPREWE